MSNLVTMPAALQERMETLQALCERYPIKIPVAEIARYYDTTPDTIGVMIKSGRCPFAVGFTREAKGRNTFLVSTMAFWLWETNHQGV